MKLGEIHQSAKKWFHSHKSRKKTKKHSRLLYKRHYSDTSDRTGIEEKTAIVMFDGKIRHGGLADRLRGILSIYSICKELGMTFKLYFNHPFELEEYLAPNGYDWKISPNDISFNKRDSEPIYAVDFDWDFVSDYLTGRINSISKKQIHIYTNSSFIFSKGEGTYSRLFNELFKATAPVMDEVIRYKETLAPKYISVSTRFMNLLGDFNERNCTPLSENEQEDLIKSCLDQIEKLHDEHPDHKVFVASDSYKFLCEANKREYVTISGGKPVHIDNCSGQSVDDSNKKTFIDFFLIAGAEHVFMLHKGMMYRGNFAYSASLVNNRPYKVIDF